MESPTEHLSTSLYHHEIPLTNPDASQLGSGSSSNISEKTTIDCDSSFGRTPSPKLNNADEILSSNDGKTGSGLKGVVKVSECFEDEKGLDEVVEDDDPLLRDIPLHVRRVVSLTDDTTLPVITFRYLILTLMFVVPGAFLTQMDQFRTTFAPYSIFVVQIGVNYVGDWMAKTLPAWEIRIPFTKRSFNLNPGPFSSKEHALVTITASSGATYNLAYVPISMSEVYFNNKIHPVICLLFMWAVVILGYGYAAIARQVLVYDPKYPWYKALCQTALFETQKHQRESPSPVSSRQMTVFLLVLIGVTLWQFLPEFVFPMLSSLSIICWIAPHNQIANFIGGGLGGMGFLNFSLDWSNIDAFGTSSGIFLTPWWTQAICFAAFVINCWILLPLAKWGGMTKWNYHLMSNRMYQENGTVYPLLHIMTSNGQLNETAYAEMGELYVGAQVLWGMFFSYASYASAMVWMGIFGYPALKAAYKIYMERRKTDFKVSINEQYSDQLNILMRSYEEVPLSWYLVLVAAAFAVVMTVVMKTDLRIPWWTALVAMATGAIVVVPLGWLYAVSNFQLPIGTTNELIYGLMINSCDAPKEPLGAVIYSSIAGDAWYRAQIMLQDQKVGHYMHIPPRAVFFSQVFGTLMGVPINYAAMKWVLNSKFDYISGKVPDPTNQWTGQSLASDLTSSVQYVLIGPKRLFQGAIYQGIPYGFLLGAVTPILLFTLHRYFPRAKFNLWNSTIFFATLSDFWGNVTTGAISAIIGGFIVMYWAYRKHYEVWARYNYILAAAFDAGFNLNLLLLFLAFGSAKVVMMPAWWGNNEQSVERCFALQGG